MSKIKVHIYIQARVGSSRLPGKVLLPVAGLPSIVLCARRASNTGLKVRVLTSTAESDDLLVEILRRHRIDYLRGAHENVLERFARAAKNLENKEIIVRLTADNLFPDGIFIDELVQRLISRNLNYYGTHSPLDGLPYGMSAEAFTIGALRKSWNSDKSLENREHVTPWIRQNLSSDIFMPARNKVTLNHLRCTIDTLEDYRRINNVFSNIRNPINIPWYKLCEKLKRLSDAPKFRVPFVVKNGIAHSRVTLGTAQFGMDYGIVNRRGAIPYGEIREIINKAAAHGVAFLDCARAYGNAERVVGKVISGGVSAPINIITKLEPYDRIKFGNDKQKCIAAVDSSVFRSCRELRMHSLHTVLLHRWKHRNNRAIWNRLKQLKSEGVINNLGASVQSQNEAVSVLKDPDITHIQLPFNILDRRWKNNKIRKLVDKRQDMVIHARSVFLQGILGAPPQLWPKIRNFDAVKTVKTIEKLTQDLKRKNKLDLCVAYTLAQPWITSIVIGVDSLQQLRQNLKLSLSQPLNADECLFLESRLKGAPVALLDPSRWRR
jgi:spore coat polysaccharide biosynthesis protein SpsF